MGDIERLSPNFLGINNEYINREDFIRMFADMLDIANYSNNKRSIQQRPIDKVYDNNEKFWIDALQGGFFPTMRIQLNKFHLIEWLPLSPGRYFTAEAKHAREFASRHVRGSEYLLLGKLGMVLGGVGSIRLAAKDNYYFLGATSTGISHQGIPIAMTESDYNRVIQVVKENGGYLTNIVGSLQIFPPSVSLIQYDGCIPKYCLFVDSIEILKPSFKTEVLVTVAITFPSLEYGKYGGEFTKEKLKTMYGKSWSFCSFYPNVDTKNLKVAVDWLKGYALRYSKFETPPILNDFDEHYQHFNNPVEFSLKNIRDGKFDFDLFNFYKEKYGMNVIRIDNYVAGDNINITGSGDVNAIVKSYVRNVRQSTTNDAN